MCVFLIKLIQYRSEARVIILHLTQMRLQLYMRRVTTLSVYSPEQYTARRYKLKISTQTAKFPQGYCLTRRKFCRIPPPPYLVCGAHTPSLYYNNIIFYFILLFHFHAVMLILVSQRIEGVIGNWMGHDIIEHEPTLTKRGAPPTVVEWQVYRAQNK